MVKFGSHFLFYILSEIIVNFDRSLGATLMDARERARNSVFYTSGAQILEGVPSFKQIQISDPHLVGGFKQIGSSLKLFLKIDIFILYRILLQIMV